MTQRRPWIRICYQPIRSAGIFPPGTRAKNALLASDQSQIERTPFFWRHYVRSFTISFNKRHSRPMRVLDDTQAQRQL
jgi:hypothetical protein